MSVVVPSNVVAAYRARRDCGSADGRSPPVHGEDQFGTYAFRPIGDLARICVLEVADAVIERWRASDG